MVDEEAEDEEEPIEEEEESEGTDTELVVYNPPAVRPAAVRRGYQGPTPIWGNPIHH